MKKILANIIKSAIILILITHNITVFAANKNDLQNEQSEIDDEKD